MSKGRQSDEYLDSFVSWRKRDIDLIRETRDRLRWRTMVAHAYLHGT